MRCFPVAFLANGVFIVTHGGIELITPVLLVCMLNHYATAPLKVGYPLITTAHHSNLLYIPIKGSEKLIYLFTTLQIFNNIGTKVFKSFISLSLQLFDCFFLTKKNVVIQGARTLRGSTFYENETQFANGMQVSSKSLKIPFNQHLKKLP